MLRIDLSMVRLSFVDTLFRPVNGTTVNSKKWQNRLVVPWADLEMVRWSDINILWGSDEGQMVRYLYSGWTRKGVRL